MAQPAALSVLKQVGAPSSSFQDKATARGVVREGTLPPNAGSQMRGHVPHLGWCCSIHPWARPGQERPTYVGYVPPYVLGVVGYSWSSGNFSDIDSTVSRVGEAVKPVVSSRGQQVQAVT